MFGGAAAGMATVAAVDSMATVAGDAGVAALDFRGTLRCAPLLLRTLAGPAGTST
jgi:hypothetical protein